MVSGLKLLELVKECDLFKFFKQNSPNDELGDLSISLWSAPTKWQGAP
jgi:hypothetical protein